jgi:hypothetical protein
MLYYLGGHEFGHRQRSSRSLPLAQGAIIMTTAMPVDAVTARDIGDSGVLFGHVFTTKTTLPAGNWMLSVLTGDAWVFCGDTNFPLHEGDYALIAAGDGPVTIRSLYTKGFALYRAAPLENGAEDDRAA